MGKTRDFILECRFDDYIFCFCMNLNSNVLYEC